MTEQLDLDLRPPEKLPSLTWKDDRVVAAQEKTNRDVGVFLSSPVCLDDKIIERQKENNLLPENLPSTSDRNLQRFFLRLKLGLSFDQSNAYAVRVLKVHLDRYFLTKLKDWLSPEQIKIWELNVFDSNVGEIWNKRVKKHVHDPINLEDVREFDLDKFIGPAAELGRFCLHQYEWQQTPPEKRTTTAPHYEALFQFRPYWGKKTIIDTLNRALVLSGRNPNPDSFTDLPELEKKSLARVGRWMMEEPQHFFPEKILDKDASPEEYLENIALGTSLDLFPEVAGYVTDSVDAVHKHKYEKKNTISFSIDSSLGRQCALYIRSTIAKKVLEGLNQIRKTRKSIANTTVDKTTLAEQKINYELVFEIVTKKQIRAICHRVFEQTQKKCVPQKS